MPTGSNIAFLCQIYRCTATDRVYMDFYAASNLHNVESMEYGRTFEPKQRVDSFLNYG
jgi:hypothetical protein